MHAQKNPSIKDFEGFELSFYNESSGNRYLKLDYQKALTEKPKLGFLKFGLSFLKVEDLSIYLDARFAQPDLVSDLLLNCPVPEVFVMPWQSLFPWLSIQKRVEFTFVLKRGNSPQTIP